MEYTNVLQQYRDFVSKFKSTLEKNSLIGLEPWTDLLDEASGLEEILNDPVISKPLDNYSIEKSHSIDVLGLGPKVISLYEDNYSPLEIAKIINQACQSKLTSNDVDSWITSYSKQSIISKAELEFGNVFDLKTQLQDIFIDIKTHLEEIKAMDRKAFNRTSKDEVIIAGREQLRQLVKDAAGLITLLDSREDVRRFQKIIFEEINKESPACVQRIMRRIREQKSIQQTLDI